MSLAQVKAWFANKRNRTLNTKPKRQRSRLQQQFNTLCEQLATDEMNSDNVTEVEGCDKHLINAPKPYHAVLNRISDVHFTAPLSHAYSKSSSSDIHSNDGVSSLLQSNMYMNSAMQNNMNAFMNLEAFST